MHNDKELHLTCGCHNHELHLEKDCCGDPMWYGSFWIRGYSGEKSWRWTLRQLWQILKTGRPYGDEVVLSKEHLEELQVYVQEQLDQLKK
jgi:hypothetical protein